MNLLAVLLAILPMDAHLVQDGVDLLEKNTVYDDEGRPVFVQVIGWNWNGYAHEVAGWRAMTDKTWRPPSVTWVDGQRLYAIRGKYWRETHYQWDEEISQREILPKCHRRGLFGVKE